MKQRRAKAEGRKTKKEGRRGTSLLVAACGVGLVVAGLAAAALADVSVTVNVLAGDPNDPNDPNGVIQCDGGEEIPYHIIAKVVAADDLEDPNLSHDPNLSQGLGALVVTLRTNFVDPNLVGGPNEIATPLEVYASTGLPLNDQITDVGGSQDLIGDGNAVAFADGEWAVIAQGVVTAPSADGTYHVWATPQEVSVLGPNLAQGPTGYPPDEIRIGQGFYIVVGDSNYHTLEVVINDLDAGTVTKDPDLTVYPDDMEVTLTAVPFPGEQFEQWYIGEPNCPNDANYIADPNYFTPDANNPMTLVMTRDHVVVAWFAMSCGSGAGMMLPPMMAALTITLLILRRTRLHSYKSRGPKR